MKHVEKVLGVSMSDFENIVPSLKTASKRMLDEY